MEEGSAAGFFAESTKLYERRGDCMLSLFFFLLLKIYIL